MRASIITRNLHSKGFAAIIGTIAPLCLLYAFLAGMGAERVAEAGFALPPAGEWLPAGWLDFAAALAVNGAVLLMMVLLNKVYNILRSLTGLYICLFCVMLAATPALAVQLYTAPLLALAVALGLFMLFGCFRSPAASGSVFLVFAMLSALAATQYSFALFIPVFFIICAQMRILKPRTVVAALVGIVTPWWIYFGFGIVDPTQIRLPEFANLFAQEWDLDAALTIGCVGFTSLLLILSMVLNLFRTIAYNARSRAFNGAITIVAIFTIICLVGDFLNYRAYVVLLDFCAAIQTAHYFSTHRADRSWVAIAVILTIYLALYACQILI